MTQNHKVCTSCGYTGSALFQLTKLGNVKCPKCDRLTMVSLRSPKGQAVLKQGRGQPAVWADALGLTASK